MNIEVCDHYNDPMGVAKETDRLKMEQAEREANEIYNRDNNRHVRC